MDRENASLLFLIGSSQMVAEGISSFGSQSKRALKLSIQEHAYAPPLECAKLRSTSVCSLWPCTWPEGKFVQKRLISWAGLSLLWSTPWWPCSTIQICLFGQALYEWFEPRQGQSKQTSGQAHILLSGFCYYLPWYPPRLSGGSWRARWHYSIVLLVQPKKQRLVLRISLV